MEIQTTYRIPEHFACAIINDDYSGLSDDDEKHLNEWLKRVKPGWACAPDGEPFFAHGHALNANEGADCYDIAFIKPAQ